MKKFIVIYFLIISFAFAGEPGDGIQTNTANQAIEKNNQEFPKPQEPVSVKAQPEMPKPTVALISSNNPDFVCPKSVKGDNPFSRDLSYELLLRQANGACVYPLNTLRVVGILKSKDFKKNNSNSRFNGNLALIQIPNNQDQVIVYEGQMIGSRGGVVRQIDERGILVEENGKLVRLQLIQ